MLVLIGHGQLPQGQQLALDKGPCVLGVALVLRNGMALAVQDAVLYTPCGLYAWLLQQPVPLAPMLRLCISAPASVPIAPRVISHQA